jgi:hypothetical protein
MTPKDLKHHVAEVYLKAVAEGGGSEEGTKAVAITILDICRIEALEAIKGGTKAEFDKGARAASDRIGMLMEEFRDGQAS